MVEPASAFTRRLPQRGDLCVEERRGLGVAALMARRGVTSAALAAKLGLSPPRTPARIAADGLALIGAGPGVWLAIRDDASSHWAADLAASLSGLAAVSDQSSGYVIMRIAGARARDLLSRGAFIDFAAFPAGAAATTDIAHIGVTIWALEDAFEIALFRSYADSFAAWLDHAAAGLDVGQSVHV